VSSEEVPNGAFPQTRRFAENGTVIRRALAAVTLTCGLVAQAPKPPVATQAAKQTTPTQGAKPAAAPPADPKTAPGGGPTGPQRVFVLKYADPFQMANLLRAFGARAVVDSEAHAVAVASAFPDVLSAIDEAVQRLDVPAAAQNIELTAYYVTGANGTPVGGVVPKDLEAVTAQLASSSGLRNYRLLDALTIRLRAGQGADTSGLAGPSAGANSPMITTDFRVGSATVSSDGGAVRIDHLSAGVKLPVPGALNPHVTTDLALNADVDLKEGQKTVVGRVGMNRDQALFLVLIARVPK